MEKATTSDAQHPAATEAKKRTYVSISEFQNDDKERKKAILVGPRLSDNAIRRSGLLTDMQGTEGLATLPANISDDEIRVWVTVCSLDVPLSTDDLVSVLKVRYFIPCTPVE